MKERSRVWLWLALTAALCLLLAGCEAQPPVLIGMAVELTGRRSEVGVAARNGAELAVEAVNAAGGVNGVPLKLVVQDDQGVPEGALLADSELAANGVVAIIGHITSEQTAAALEQINRLGVVLISPTSSSSALSGMDDHFFRVTSANEHLAASMARHIFLTRGLRQALAIYDLSNRSFTETWWEHFAREFRLLGGTCQALSYTSGETDLKHLVAGLKAEEPEAVVLIASAVDTALIMQYAAQEALGAQFFATSWAQTSELMEKGGQVVEGLELSATFSDQTGSEAYAQFAQAYREKYGGEPGLGASHAYEAVLVLSQALEQTGGKAEGLPEALLGIQKFQGLLGEISMNEFGDVQRDLYIMRVENGEFKLISVVSLTP